MARYAYEKLVKDYFRDLSLSITAEGTLDPRNFRKYNFDPFLIFVFHLAPARAHNEGVGITNNWRMAKKEIYDAYSFDNIKLDGDQDHAVNDKSVYGKDKVWADFKDLLPADGRGLDYEKMLLSAFKNHWLICRFPELWKIENFEKWIETQKGYPFFARGYVLANALRLLDLMVTHIDHLLSRSAKFVPPASGEIVFDLKMRYEFVSLLGLRDFNHAWVKDRTPTHRAILQAVFVGTEARKCDRCSTVATLQVPPPEVIDVSRWDYSCCLNFRGTGKMQFLDRQPRSKIKIRDKIVNEFVCQACGWKGGKSDSDVIEHMLRHQSLPMEYVRTGYSRMGLESLSNIVNINEEAYVRGENLW